MDHYRPPEPFRVFPKRIFPMDPGYGHGGFNPGAVIPIKPRPPATQILEGKPRPLDPGYNPWNRSDLPPGAVKPKPPAPRPGGPLPGGQGQVDRLQHYVRPERGPWQKPLPTIKCVDPPYWELVLPYTPRDVRAPSEARIEALDVDGGDSVTFWAGRAPSKMTLQVGFDSTTTNRPETGITEELAFLRRITGPGPEGKGIRVRLNFGEAQDQLWFIERVTVENKERRGTDVVHFALVTIEMVQAVAADYAFSPAEKAAAVIAANKTA